MAKSQPHAVHGGHGATLSRRERQIMDILYRGGRATAGEVMDQLAGDPSYSTVRTQLRVLEDKGHVRHEEEGLRYVYTPIVPRHAVRQRSEEHTSELQSRIHLVCRLLLEKKKHKPMRHRMTARSDQRTDH